MARTRPTPRGRKESASGGRPKAAKRPAAARKKVAKTPKAEEAPRPKRVAPTRLLQLEEAMRTRIVGKDAAVERVARVIRVRLSAFDLRPERPKGVFLLVGPHGVGKSEFAYAVAEAVYGRDEKVVTIDLDEFADDENLARIGSVVVNTPEPVLVEGVLTTPVRQDPQAVLLLKGLEQTHPAFHRMLLQILERGLLEDMLGPVSFRDSIFFVTVTLRRDDALPAGIGFARASRAPRELMRERLERVFPPDLLDAFDEIVELPALTAAQVRAIARYKVDKVLARMNQRRKRIAVEDSVLESLITDDLCRTQGAAFLNRTLEDRLFNPLARYLLSHRKPTALRVELDGGQVTIHDLSASARRP